jgi:predicted SnoaL-like aldol condensation-catalyzing enzyme
MKVKSVARLFVVALAASAALTLGAAAASAGTSGDRDPKGCDISKSQLERNKRTVVAYYTTAFNDKNPRKAVARYGGPVYIQHNPLAANGFDAFIAFVEFFTSTYPDIHVDIRRVIAECDLVVTHAVGTGTPYGQFGSKIVDIFRLNERGKIIEHWDVLAPITDPAQNQNGNPEV